LPADIQIDIFLREQSIEDRDNITDRVLSKLKFESARTITHSIGTNHISVILDNKKNLSEKIKSIANIKEIEYFILRTNPRQEISDAIADHDYFKAFALCSTMYDSLGKRILMKYINKNSHFYKKIEGLHLDDVINNLYDYELIDQSLKSYSKRYYLTLVLTAFWVFLDFFN
jgi:hypothetical protein